MPNDLMERSGPCKLGGNYTNCAIDSRLSKKRPNECIALVPLSGEVLAPQLEPRLY